MSIRYGSINPSIPRYVDWAVVFAEIADEVEAERQAIANRPRIHTCDICGTGNMWVEAWSWYGSMLDEEDGVVLKICGEPCMEKLKGLGDPDVILRGLREQRGLPPYRKGQHAKRGI